jgi:outer membrane protein OmpA-like peptidoglycan-associated protein
MPTKPMLDDLELLLVQQLEADERHERAQHAVPALEGDFLQALGRRATAFTLNGVIANEVGSTVAEELKKLREKFRAAAPVNFVADIATATQVDTVLIEEMSVRELAGKPQRFEYAFALREFIPAPAPEEEPPPPIPEPLVATLIVEVIVEGQPNFDFSLVTVTVEGNKDDGTPHNVTLTNRTNNVWTEEDFPPGTYTAKAVVTDPPPMSGSEPATVQEGQTTQVTIILRPGSSRVIAKAFVVNFRFDKAFIEPCMRKVLNAVAEHARTHGQEKMVIVGHTDKSGSDDYNYSLGDRRARSVFAYLNFGNDQAGSLAEWNEIRRTSTGTLPSLRDNWGVMQYQYMLEDLGFLPGNVDGVHGAQTDAAVQAFRASKGLPPGTTVDDAVWAELIADYHGQEPQAVNPNQLLPNVNTTGCNGGPLKWLSAGEEMPLPSTPPTSCNPNPGTAWRPNRRVEILFVAETTLPCQVPEPVTFRITPPGPVGPAWCLGGGSPTKRSCFLTRDPNDPDPTLWLVQPAEPGSITVTGSIRRPDGTPLVNTEYVLMAPDGEFMDGEHKCDSPRGTPIPGRTDANGQFNYSRRSPTPVGIYTMEVKLPNPPQVAHVATEPPSSGRGSIVCTRLDTTHTVFDVIVFDGTPVPAVVTPSITLARNFVIVKKPHTNPARVQVTLRSNNPFTGTGTLTRSGNIAAVRLFTALIGGTELTFNGTDNVFTGAALAAGVSLFAEAGPAPSAAVDDYTLTLTLNPAGTGATIGAPATATLTAVLFTLDIFLSRPAPATAPTAMSEADKINIGRHVQLPDPGFTHERAMLVVRQPVPAIPVTLELLPQNARVRAFTQELPANAQAAIPNPQVFAPGAIPAAGSTFFVEGVTLSTALRDTGYLLRVQGIVAEVDRVAITTCAATLTSNLAPFNVTVARVQIEGILNRELNPNGGTFALADLFNTQANSLFRARVDIVGIAGTTVRVSLTSNQAGGAQLERRDITLTRTTGDRFVSLPILAIPDAIPRGEITFAAPQNIEVIRTRAGGRLQLAFDTGSGIVKQEVHVRGRVLQMCTLTIQGAAPNIARDLTTANRVMAQDGIEFRLSQLPNVNNPALLDIQRTTCPLTIGGDNNRSAEETALFALGRAACAVNYLTYFIRSDSMGLNGCSAYPVGQPGVTVSDGASQYSFAHENGHVMHLPHDGRPNNLMTGAGTNNLPANPATVHLLPDQCLLMDNSGFLTFVE